MSDRTTHIRGTDVSGKMIQFEPRVLYGITWERFLSLWGSVPITSFTYLDDEKETCSVSSQDELDAFFRICQGLKSEMRTNIDICLTWAKSSAAPPRLVIPDCEPFYDIRQISPESFVKSTSDHEQGEIIYPSMAKACFLQNTYCTNNALKTQDNPISPVHLACTDDTKIVSALASYPLNQNRTCTCKIKNNNGFCFCLEADFTPLSCKTSGSSRQWRWRIKNKGTTAWPAMTFVMCLTNRLSEKRSLVPHQCFPGESFVGGLDTSGSFSDRFVYFQLAFLSTTNDPNDGAVTSICRFGPRVSVPNPEFSSKP